MRKRLQKLIAASRTEIAAVLGLVAAAVLLAFRLGSLPARVSTGELQTYHGNLQAHQIGTNPLYAPYKIVDFALLHLREHSVATARLASVGFALVAVMLFFVIMLRWHGRRSAWLATALFATSGWLLHIGRLGMADIVWVVVPLALVLLGSWITTTEHHGLAVFATVFMFGLALFVPAAIWFVVATAVLSGKAIANHVTKLKGWQLASASLICLLFVGTLVYSFYRSPDLVRPWLGLPHTMPSMTGALRLWADSVLYLFVRGPGDSALWLGHAPILDVFTTAVCLLGIYFYAKHFRNPRARLLVIFAIIGSILTALNGAASMSWLVPLAYLVAGTGLTYLLRQWLTVFPRNPVARAAGVTLITLAVLTSAMYHSVAYFVAWQHSPATTAVFRQTLIQ